jgi:hypothetical protein
VGKLPVLAVGVAISGAVEGKFVGQVGLDAPGEVFGTVGKVGGGEFADAGGGVVQIEFASQVVLGVVGTEHHEGVAGLQSIAVG